MSEKKYDTHNSPSICLCIIKCFFYVFSHQVYHIHAQTNNESIAGADAWVKVPEACKIYFFTLLSTVIVRLLHGAAFFSLFSHSCRLAIRF